MKLFKAGKYTWNEILDLSEIAYRLSLLWFDITYFYSFSEEFHKASLEDPLKYLNQIVDPKYHHFLDDKGYWYVPGDDFWSDMADVTFERKIVDSPHIKKMYNTDIIHDIQKHQGEGVLFMVGVSYYILHGEKIEEWCAGGHVILVSGINQSGKVVIFDPGQPLLMYYEVDPQRFMDAVKEMGEYTFMKISYDERSEV